MSIRPFRVQPYFYVFVFPYLFRTIVLLPTKKSPFIVSISALYWKLSAREVTHHVRKEKSSIRKMTSRFKKGSIA